VAHLGSSHRSSWVYQLRYRHAGKVPRRFLPIRRPYPAAAAKAQFCRDISNFNAQTQSAVNANDPTKKVSVILQFAPRFNADGEGL
jgi:hypothetical protein